MRRRPAGWLGGREDREKCAGVPADRIDDDRMDLKYHNQSMVATLPSMSER
jgi:hypothetical protein